MVDIPQGSRRPFNGPIPQRFSSKYDRYRQLGGLVDIDDDARAYAGDGPLWDVERLMFLSLAFDQICKEELEGDFAELGVYKGSTAVVLARYARRLKRHVYLMDTYEGFDARDFAGIDAGRVRGFADTSMEAVRARVGEEAASFVKGYFPQTADQLPADGRYCLVHIDTDLYAPIMSGLEYFYPRVVPGGFLIIHDYGSMAWAGAEKAVDAFFADKPECVVHIPDSCGSAVVRKARPPNGGLTWLRQQQRLPMNEWQSAKDGALSRLLTEGWAAPEGWGVWGVGMEHSMVLVVDNGNAAQAALDLDIHAFIWDACPERIVEIVTNDKYLAEVSLNQNRTIITVILPTDTERSTTFHLNFRHRNVAVPKEVIAGSYESRELGIAVHRVRLRPI